MICFCNKNMEKIMINNISYYKCHNCGFLTKKIILSNELERARYDKHVCDEGYFKYMHNVFERIRPYIKGKNVLDFGCGQVHALSDILAANGYNASFYDLYYYPNLEKKKYDTIILIEVFEHLRNPYITLFDLRDLLAENGVVIIMTKGYDEVNNLAEWWYLRDETHISFITSDTLNKWSIPFELKVIDNDIFVLKSI